MRVDAISRLRRASNRAAPRIASPLSGREAFAREGYDMSYQDAIDDNSDSVRVAGIILHRLARRLWGVLGQTGPHPRIVTQPMAKSGRVGGRVRWQPRPVITLRIGRHCDRASLMMVLLHELTHVAVGPIIEPHGRFFNELLVKSAAVVWRVSVPTRGFGYKPSRALEIALREMLDKKGRACSRI